MDLEFEFAREPEALELLPAEASLTGSPCGPATWNPCGLFTCQAGVTCVEDSVFQPH